MKDNWDNYFPVFLLDSAMTKAFADLEKMGSPLTKNWEETMELFKNYLMIVLLLCGIAAIVYLNPYARDVECCENSDRIVVDRPCRVQVKVCNETPHCKSESWSCKDLARAYEDLQLKARQDLLKCREDLKKVLDK